MEREGGHFIYRMVSGDFHVQLLMGEKLHQFHPVYIVHMFTRLQNLLIMLL